VNDEQESKELVKMVNDSGATVLMVCATSPKQEIWITRYRHLLKNVKLFMALGATVDFEAGVVRRCPLWIQRLGMEWFWRFSQEPRRLFKRYWVDDMKFFWYFGKQLLGTYKNPF
jgi:exopolysaccharide biosynthesis WecB/TagA/CpsF family protein